MAERLTATRAFCALVVGAASTAVAAQAGLPDPTRPPSAAAEDTARPAGGPPELVMRPSIPPNLSAVAATHVSMASRERTSTGIANTFDPVSRSIRDAADAIDAWSRDEIDTIAPSAASACATAYPSPLLAPAINMTLFLS